MFKYVKVRNFCGILISRGFLTIFEIRGILNFAVQPKYYIPQHFNSRFDQNTIVCDILVLAVLKIEFFMCVSCQHFSNFGKSRNLNANLIHFYHFFTHCWFTTVLKTPEQLLSGWKISSFSSSNFQENRTLKNVFLQHRFFHRWVWVF